MVSFTPSLWLNAGVTTMLCKATLQLSMFYMSDKKNSQNLWLK